MKMCITNYAEIPIFSHQNKCISEFHFFPRTSEITSYLIFLGASFLIFLSFINRFPGFCFFTFLFIPWRARKKLYTLHKIMIKIYLLPRPKLQNVSLQWHMIKYLGKHFLISQIPSSPIQYMKDTAWPQHHTIGELTSGWLCSQAKGAAFIFPLVTVTVLQGTHMEPDHSKWHNANDLHWKPSQNTTNPTRHVVKFSVTVTVSVWTANHSLSLFISSRNGGTLQTEMVF